MTSPSTLRFAHDTFADCSHCGKRFIVGGSPFCSAKCHRAEADRQMGRGYSARLQAERAARARREAYDRRRANA